MTEPRTAASILALLFCHCGSLLADTVTLKSGEKLDGKILSETDAEVTMSVQISATIKDERVVKRADIATLEKVQPDELAWAVVANFVPGTESLERDEYDRIKMALGYFTSTFPKSSHAALAQSRLDQFVAEHVRVNAGEVKLSGEWLSKEKVQEERVQIAGRILLNRMKRAAAAGQLTEAMAIFDQMEKTFPGSLSFPEAVELGRRILPSLSAAVTQRLAAVMRQMEDEKQRLATSKGAEHVQLEALLKQEHARADATIAASERAGIKWPALQPATERSLSALASRATSEMARLNGMRLEKMQESAKAAQDGATALSVGNFEAADKALREAASAWSENELAKRMQVKLAEAKKAASAPKQPAPAPIPAPATKRGPSASSAFEAAPAAAAESEQTSETPLFKRPAFFIGVAIVVAFGAVFGKKFAKARAAKDDVLGR